MPSNSSATSEIRIVELYAGDPLLASVERMLVQEYKFLAGCGLAIPLAPGGEKIWRKGIEVTLGKTSQLLLAFDGTVEAGFTFAMLRLQAAYVVPVRTAFWSHLYVEPEARGKHVGLALASRIEQWCREKEVVTVEGNVPVNNSTIWKFMKSLGYADDVMQVRKNLRPL